MKIYTQLIENCDKYGASLIAVSKRQSIEKIKALYDLGHRDFGENRVQEIRWKEEELPSDIRWHLIGQLQRNKVKYIAGYIHMIQSVDSVVLLKEIDKRASQHNRCVQVLLQVKIGKEQTKSGFEMTDLNNCVATLLEEGLEHVSICGIMGIGTNSPQEDVRRLEFQSLKQMFDDLKGGVFFKTPEFKEISMGMSADYLIALEEGSTMIRVGSLIFGSRES